MEYSGLDKEAHPLHMTVAIFRIARAELLNDYLLSWVRENSSQDTVDAISVKVSQIASEDSAALRKKVGEILTDFDLPNLTESLKEVLPPLAS